MSNIEKSIEVDVPVRTAYNQWTQFEQFPQFMKGVKSVRQLDASHLQWRAEIAGKDVEWTAEITHQEPDRHIGWRSTSGAPNAGSVKFEQLAANRTRVTLRLDYVPEGAVEKTGSAMGVVSQRIEGDLHKFKKFIEERGQETGAWRGEIHEGSVSRGSSGLSTSAGSGGTQGTSGSAYGAGGAYGSTPGAASRNMPGDATGLNPGATPGSSTRNSPPETGSRPEETGASGM
jgi:hypothetical protein